MTVSRKGLELAVKLGTRDAHTCSLICRQATTLHRLAEEECNGHPACASPLLPMDTVRKLQAQWEARVEKQTKRAEGRVLVLALGLPMVKDVKFGGDPRGPSVLLVCKDPSLHDSWGHDGVYVPCR